MERWAELKEDVLEQIVDDYLQFKGYFTKHNVPFKPSPEHPEYVQSLDQVASDVDVVGYNPRLGGRDKVKVVSCKAWQKGFNTSAELRRLQGLKSSGKKQGWRHFRELWIPKWNEAFRREIENLTGEKEFTYVIAATRFIGDRDVAAWREHPTIKANIPGCGFEFLTMEEMWGTMLKHLGTEVAASDIGRLAQLLKAAGLTDSKVVAPPTGPTPGSAAAIQDELEEDLDV
jgi:hypothetical protein